MNAQPVFFGPSQSPLFGWVHPGSHRSMGLVLCSPWGREELSAHHTLREWALRLSEAGWPCLRFDYAGEGDSAGDPLQAGGLSAWQASVSHAIDELKRQTGVSTVCLLGIRLGAALASLAALTRDDVAGLIAVAPVVKGRGFVRELTALQAASHRTGEPQPLAGVFQSGGYVMSEATRDALSSLDLIQAAQAPAAHVLVLDRDDMPPSKAWAQAMQGQGAAVTQQAHPGFVAMMADPHHAQAPVAMIEASLQWLRQTWPGDAGTRGDASRPASACGPDVRHATAELPPAAPGQPCLVEETLTLPATPAFGILSRAVDGSVAPSGHAILLLNSGSNRRVGPSRTSVTLARRWAADGHVVLRLDLAGIGDSDIRPGGAPNMSYPHEAMADVRAALALLGGRPGIKRVHACGLCSGAYHALKAARDGMPLASVILINPLIYFNAEGLQLVEGADLSDQKVHTAAASYRASAASPEKWLKLLKGQVNLRTLGVVVARRLGMALGGRLRGLARRLHWPLKDDLGSELRRLGAAGVMVHFVFARNDPGEVMLREQAGDVLPALERQGTMALHLIEGADHVFSDVLLRGEMLACVARIMSSLTGVG